MCPYHKLINTLSADYKNIKIENYNYSLSDDRIAKYPKEKRDESKLLYYNKGEISTFQFKNLSELLQSNDLLVFNNAKVIQARLAFVKETGAAIEIFCLEPHQPADYNLAFQVTDKCEWKCLVGNLKKWKSGKLVKEIEINGANYILEASHTGKTINAEIIQFNWYPAENQGKIKNICFGDILETIGSTQCQFFCSATGRN